jgi:hypothetical protein
VAVQNHFVELNEGADSPCSITFAFKRLRRSDRLASQAKRTYEAMQVASKKTGKLPKRLKLATDKPATDESNTYGTADDETVDERLVVDKPASCEPARDDPATEPATLESINNPSVIKPNTTGPRENLSEGIHREGTDGVMTGSALASPVDGDSGALGSDLSAITHANGLAILDEYFPKSATDSGPLNGAVVPELPTSIANIAPPGSPLIPSIQPPAPGAFTTPSAGPNAVLPEASDILPPEQLGSLYPEQSGILYPEQAGNGSEASDSTSHSGSPGSVSCCTDLTRCPSSETNDTDIDSLNMVTYPPFTKRLVLDDGVQLLEHVLVALESAYDDRGASTASVPGVLDEILMTSDHTLFVKIMTSITENWAKCNRLIAKPALEVAQERLAEVEQNSLSRIKGDRYQMSITRGDRTKSEHLRHAILCLDRRELSRIELRDLLSEPLELMGEFIDENDYENAIKHIERENADDIRTQLRRRWKETYYWPMIQQRAKMIGPLPNAPGPKTEITPQEKVAAKKLVAAMGYGQSRNNIFKWTSYLKLLSDLRDKGTTSFLLCRTSEFKSYFFQHPKDLDMLLSWNKVYDFPLRQLRLRVIAEEANDFSGKSDIEERWIYDRLHAPQNMCWGDQLCVWEQESTERENFLANHSLRPSSAKSNIHVLRHGIKGQLDRNKAIYISLVPYEGKSEKRTISNKTASTELLAVAPLVAIAPGDFLGIFPGRLRYTDQRPIRAIGGPVLNLWLDYSEVMGKLNKIKVAKSGEMVNVCLAWEGVNEVKGDKSFCQYLRVLVIATRHIMPFDQLIRPPSGAGTLSETWRGPRSHET